MKTLRKDKKDNKTSSIIERLKEKSRIIIVNNDTFEEKRSFVISIFSFFIYLGFAFFLFVFLAFCIVSFTSLKTFIPGYPNPIDQQLIKSKDLENMVKLSEFENKIDNDRRYFYDLKLILQGKPLDLYNKDSLLKGEKISIKDVSFDKTKNDSILRAKIDDREKYDISVVLSNNKSIENLSGVLFFPPLKGEITNRLEIKKGHYGLDIIALKNESVKAVQSGTVVYNDWSPENGHVIHIQHQKNLMSIYKHSSFLLKKTGDAVKAGDPIAIVGNSGDLSTGPHLHFELWHNGVPIDPEKFIDFE